MVDVGMFATCVYPDDLLRHPRMYYVIAWLLHGQQNDIFIYLIVSFLALRVAQPTCRRQRSLAVRHSWTRLRLTGI